MSQEGITKIKMKLQELTNLIKEQTAEETQEIKDEILQNVYEMKSTIEERFQGAEKLGPKLQDKFQDKFGGNLQEFFGELEGKALKVQNTIQEKYSHGMAHKDEIVVNAADSLIEAINRVKNALHSKSDI